MTRVLLTCCVLTMVSLVPRPASADSILDPIIGVRGLPLGGSQDVTDPSFQSGSDFVDCGTLFTDMVGQNYICASYNLTQDFANGLFAVDLTFTADTQLIPVDLLDISDGAGGTNPFGGFTQFAAVAPNTIRLFGGAGPNGELLCGTAVCQGAPDPVLLSALSFATLSPGDDAVVFIGPNRDPNVSYGVSLTNPQNIPVPEPATAMLMGLGLVVLVGRRQGRSRAI